MASFKDRIIRAAMLDISLYREVDADEGAMGQAAEIVILSSAAAGVGTIGLGGLGGILTATIASLIGWCIWAVLTYLIGTKVLAEPQTKDDPVRMLPHDCLFRLPRCDPGPGDNSAPHPDRLFCDSGLDVIHHDGRGEGDPRLHRHDTGRSCLSRRLDSQCAHIGLSGFQVGQGGGRR